MKRLWISSNGQLYVRRVGDQKMIRLVSCNMSWLPDFFWKRLIQLTTVNKKEEKNLENISNFQEVNLQWPWSTRLKNVILKTLKC